MRAECQRRASAARVQAAGEFDLAVMGLPAKDATFAEEVGAL